MGLGRGKLAERVKRNFNILNVIEMDEETIFKIS